MACSAIQESVNSFATRAVEGKSRGAVKRFPQNQTAPGAPLEKADPITDVSSQRRYTSGRLEKCG